MPQPYPPFFFQVAKLCLTLPPHGLPQARLPCPSLSFRVCSNLCPLSQWWYLTISSSVPTFSLCLQSFPASGSFPASQFFESGGFIALYTTPYPQKPLSSLSLHPTDHAHFNPPHWVGFHPHPSDTASTKVLSPLHCTEDHEGSSILSSLSLSEASTSEIIYSTLKYFLF